jgi:hypothetical protein
MKLRLYYLTLLTLSLFTSCSKDDEIFNVNIDFYANVNEAALESDLLGTWAIFSLDFKGITSEIPINYQDCGRDYIVFSENGIYNEYLYQSSDCNYISNTLNWSLNQGIITLSNQFNQTEDLAVTKLTNSAFNFNTRIDVDEDGQLDVIKAYLKPYTPIEIDLVSNTFFRNTSEEYKNLISYTWQPYRGSQEFVSYEIYRNSGPNCSKSNAVLITTITDAKIINFTDLTPPSEESLCYFLRIKIKPKVLGESELQTLETNTLEATPVNLEMPTVIGNTISLNWDKSDLPYFSHYEISYSNFAANISGYGEQNVNIIEITDKNITSFIDENPPYLENPFYQINVYDIFGNKTYDMYDTFKTSWEVDFKRDELLNINHVLSYDIDPNKPIVYFFGFESNTSNSVKIHKFNYETNEVEAVSNTAPDTSTNLPIKFFNSSYDDEIFIEQGGELEVYNASTLEFKYTLKPSNINSVNDFYYTTAGFWVFTDGDNIFTYSRNNSNLTLIDVKPHFTEHQSSYNYSVFEIENNQLLLGHLNEANSILYKMDGNGFLTEERTVTVPIKQDNTRNSHYNSEDNYIINFKEKQLYTTNSFSLLSSFQQPNFASGISKNGKSIYGSDNDPDWSINDNVQHKKEALILNRTTQQVQTFTTKGYPHIIFENYKGEVISISSGMKKEDLYNKINDKVDLFIEVIK